MKRKGYVIANENEEFLAKWQENELGRLLKWSQTPEFAMVFHDKKHAQKVVDKLTDKKLWILVLLENKRQLAVGSDEEDKPHWLE